MVYEPTVHEPLPLKQKTRHNGTKTRNKGTKTDIKVRRPDIRVQSLDSSMTKDSALFLSNFLIVGLINMIIQIRHKDEGHQYQIEGHHDPT